MVWDGGGTSSWKNQNRQECQDGCYKGHHLWTSPLSRRHWAWSIYEPQGNVNRTTDRNKRGTARGKLWWGTVKRCLEHRGGKNQTAAAAQNAHADTITITRIFFSFTGRSGRRARGLHELECFRQEGGERSLGAGRLLQLLQKAAAMPLAILSDLTVNSGGKQSYS